MGSLDVWPRGESTERIEMKKGFIIMLILVLLMIIQESFSVWDVFLLALFSYLGGWMDGNCKKSTVREPYIIGDSKEIEYLTGEELKERLKRE